MKHLKRFNESQSLSDFEDIKEFYIDFKDECRNPIWNAGIRFVSLDQITLKNINFSLLLGFLSGFTCFPCLNIISLLSSVILLYAGLQRIKLVTELIFRY